ncbi:MAG: ribonuclease P protein component [Erysipelotrichaceae bacterium]
MRKAYRVRKNQEYKAIMELKQFVSSSAYTLYYAPRKEDKSRIGLSVSKKLGIAVIRNKIKRQIRMMCQDVTEFDEKFDCIILVRSAYLKQDFETNRKALENSFNKIKIKVQTL